ncbi:MAG: hypothetical protein JRJ66_01580 [Deltaproteobacteria bacterium]|nr:hypothetical protein [Deltaproteobacteria bacterium]MBW2081664.1 hypothetical protein [Deltaproteobacteria bacterium]MBW2298859.1 hypothetical protein [Deltaproteobacteria bacterium]
MKKGKKVVILGALLVLAMSMTMMSASMATAGSWDYLTKWVGHFVNVNLEKNFIQLKHVRLLQVTEEGIVIGQRYGKRTFVGYEKILTIDLVS